MEAIYTYVREVAFFTIFSSFIMAALPDGKYKKYIKLCTGTIMITILVSPVLSLMNLEGKFEWNLERAVFNQQNSDMNNKINEANNLRNTYIVNEYKKTYSEEISNIISEHDYVLNRFEMDVEDDIQKENYGYPVCFYIYISKKEDETKIPGISIERISVVEKATDSLSVAEINMRNTIADFFSMEADNIYLYME